MIWLTSDAHFYHGNILKHSRNNLLNEIELSCLRNKEKFKVSDDSVQKMNSLLIDNINRFVKHEDELMHLGDFLVFYAKKGTFKELYRTRFKEITDRINCKNVFHIKGNHDFFDLLDNVQSKDVEMLSTKHGKLWLSHYAHSVWPDMNKNVGHCYGHSHSNAEEKLDSLFSQRKSIDVGFDNAFRLFGEYRPFSIKEVFEMFNNRKGFSLDHHG